MRLAGSTQPYVLHLIVGIQRHLDLTIPIRRGRREDLTDPVRNYLEALILRQVGHPLAPPTSQIRYDDLDIVHEVDLRLDNNPPTTGTIDAIIVAAPNRAIDTGSNTGMVAGRPRWVWSCPFRISPVTTSGRASRDS